MKHIVKCECGIEAKYNHKIDGWFCAKCAIVYDNNDVKWFKIEKPTKNKIDKLLDK